MKAQKTINETFGSTPYETLVEEIKDFAIFHINLEGCIVSWNHGAETIFGYSKDEAIGQSFSTIFTLEDRAAGIPERELKIAEETGRAEDTRWHLRKDDSRFYANGATTALRDESGKLLGYAKVVRDITEHKLTEDWLRESEEFNRNVLEQSPLSIQILSPDGYTVKVNKAWEELWGVSLDQIQGYNILEDEQLEKKGIMPYIKLAFGGQFAEIPPVLYDPDETIPNLTRHTKPKRWTKTFIYPVKNSAGQVQEVVLVHEDITAQKEAEESIEHQKTLMEAVTESMLDGILIISPDGKILHFNEHFQQIWNFPAEIIESRSDEEALKWAANQTAEPAAFLARVSSVYQQSDTKVREELGMKDGRVFERFGSPVLNKGRRLGWVWTFRDITERKQEEKLQHSWAERLDEARADERRRLSRQLHDDIVQQLAVASIKLELLEEKLVPLLVQEEEEVVLADIVVIQELLNRNQESLREMAHILHSGVLEHFGLEEAFRRFKKNVDILSKEHSTVLSLDLSPEVPRLELTVENRIYHIAQESIINALKHARAKLISLSLDVRDDSVFVIIRDDGCGFDLKKIKGNGIGLASMRERSNLIGAKLDVTSQIGKGTTITLKVPLKKNRLREQALSQAH